MTDAPEPTPPPAGKRYDAFISYSHTADGELAPTVQRGLQRFAKSWRARRALEVFRDETGLAVNPDLWRSICTALDGSEWFVLMCSPEAAQSEWVGKEIERWVTTKGSDRLLPVVTEGDFVWDSARGDIDFERSTAAHPALRGVYAAEPRHIDLSWARSETDLDLRNARFRDQVAEIAAPMHGVTKDELAGEDIRQQRRTRRLARGAVAVLIVLTLIAAGSANVAVANARQAEREREEAVEQARQAMSQRLADLSETADGELRPLLAVQGHRMATTPQATGAMVAALTTSDSAGLAGRLAGHGDDVLSVEYSPDGRHVVTTDGTGAVRTFTSTGTLVATAADLGAADADFLTDERVAAATPDGVAILALDDTDPAQVVDLGASVGRIARVGDTGTVVAGTDDGGVALVTGEGEVEADVAAHDQPVRFVGASADGSTIVSASSAADPRTTSGFPDPMQAVVHDPNDLAPSAEWPSAGAVVAVSPDGTQVALSPDDLEVLPDSTSALVRVVSTDDGADVGDVFVRGFYTAKAAEFTADGESVVVATTGGNDGAPGLAWMGPIGADASETTGLTGQMDAVHDVGVAPDGTTVAVAGTDRAVPLLAVGGDSFGGPIELDGATASIPLTVSDDGHVAVVVPHLTAGQDGGQVGVGDLATGEVRLLSNSTTDQAALSPDGTRLLTVAGVVDTENGENVAAESLPPPLLDLPPSFSADGSVVAYVVEATPDVVDEVAVIDLEEGTVIGRGTAPAPMCSAGVAGTGEPFSFCDPSTSFLALSPDGTRLAVRPGGDGEAPDTPTDLLVVDVADGWSELATTTTDGPGQVSFTDDGAELLVEAGETVTAYSPTTLEPLGGGRSTDLDGRWERSGDSLAVVASCGVTLADPDTLRTVAELPLDTEFIEGGCESEPDAAWIEGGTVLLTGLDCGDVEDCPLQRWDLDPDRLADALCARAGRNLTNDEWDQFLAGWDYEVTCDEWPPDDSAPSDSDDEEPSETSQAPSDSEPTETTASPDPTDTTDQEESEEEGGLTVDDLLSVELPSTLGCADTIQLEEGYAECDVQEPFPATHSIWIDGMNQGDDGVPRGAVVGDLTDDGVPDGAVLTFANQGQFGNPFPAIWVFDSDGALLAQGIEGPDEAYSIRIVDGELEIVGADYGPNDSNASGASIPVTVRLRWDGSQMVVAG